MITAPGENTLKLRDQHGWSTDRLQAQQQRAEQMLIKLAGNIITTPGMRALVSALMVAFVRAEILREKSGET